jgi:hypothetical protein
VGAAVIPGGITYEEVKVRSERVHRQPRGRWQGVAPGRHDRRPRPDSEKITSSRSKKPKDTYRTRQKLRYPDGTCHRRHRHRARRRLLEFKVKNLTPHQDLVMIRRMDYVHGDYQAEIHVNGQRLDRACSTASGEDRKFRWRNWPYVIPAQYINTNQITIKQVMLTADRDINMFRYWFYQPQPR